VSYRNAKGKKTEKPKVQNSKAERLPFSSAKTGGNSHLEGVRETKSRLVLKGRLRLFREDRELANVDGVTVRGGHALKTTKNGRM